MKEGPNKA